MSAELIRFPVERVRCDDGLAPDCSFVEWAEAKHVDQLVKCECGSVVFVVMLGEVMCAACSLTPEWPGRDDDEPDDEA